MFETMLIIRALADENRVRALLALKQHQLCVCQITALLDLAPSTTSKHLTVLRQARLIEADKQGKWVYYRISSDSKISDLLDWLVKSVENDSQIKNDLQRIAEIIADECTDTMSASALESHSEAIHRLVSEGVSS